MKVLVASDLHGNTRFAAKLVKRALDEEIGLFVICGDVTNFGTVNLALKVLDVFAETKLPILFVPGNCDPKELANTKTRDGIQCIHRSSQEFGGYEFMGLGGSSTTPFRTPFELSEPEIEVMLEDAYNNTNRQKPLVLVSHTPPRDTLLDRTKFGISAGSASVRRFIQEKKPAAVFCGHIHESRSVDYLDSIPMVNPGPAFDGYFAIAWLKDGVRIELECL
ncbi:MAG TPA: metallophosphoesterase [Candidatus Bathyarchaeia archaeon]|nr:MAG: hypothetical protein A3K70_02230 [Candidatus Bathyarchaeota archaeon RBG_16_48_13]HJX23389.1 metallophosphoesterase [Candidatus Bathyarchaeia archaeon]